MTASARRAVIFDFGGVLVNSEIIALAELRGCLSEFGIVRSWSEVVSGFLGVSFEDIGVFVSRETGSDPGKRFRETWYARLFERFARELKVMPSAIELLDQLDAREVDYCIASGGSYRRLNYALDVTGLAERFADRKFSADAVARGKPAPEDGFAILKVGPELTFVLREMLYGLDLIASELLPEYGDRPLMRTMEALMLDRPQDWARHYDGDEAGKRLLRHFSLSDRIRYYWTVPEARAAVDRLVAVLRGKHVPLPLLWQYLPGAAHFADSPLDPEEVLIWRVGQSLSTYHRACRA